MSEHIKHHKHEAKRKLMRGFTLVEILVAITILAVLTVAAITTINPTRQLDKTRDAVRQKDLQSVKFALDLYYNDRNCYPALTGSPFAAALKDGTQWKEGNTVYMAKVPRDPSKTAYIYATEETLCPQWGVVFAKLSQPSFASNICPLASQSNCLPAGFDNTWACVTSGNTECGVIASGELGSSGFITGTGSGTLTPTPSTPFTPLSDQDFFVAQPPGTNPEIYQGTISPLFQALGKTQGVRVNIADSVGTVSSVGITVKSDTKIATYPATLTSGTGAEGVWTATWTVNDTTIKRYVIVISGTNTVGNTSNFDISIR